MRSASQGVRISRRGVRRMGMIKAGVFQTEVSIRKITGPMDPAPIFSEIPP